MTTLVGAALARTVPASERQLDYWARSGYLRPDNPDPGSGRSRQWSAEELAVAQRMARLVSAGFVPAAAAEYARLGIGCHEIAPDIFLEVGP